MVRTARPGRDGTVSDRDRCGSRLKVLTVTDAEVRSGAGIAAARLHRALRASGCDSRLALARRPRSEDAQLLFGRTGRILHAARRGIARLLFDACGRLASESLSGNFFPSSLHRLLNARNEDLVHLHWVAAEMIRVEEIASIRKPLVWTLHDEWFALGLAHYSCESVDDGNDGRVLRRYRSRMFQSLDRSVRQRKCAAWRAVMPDIVCPSSWLAERVERSGMAADCRVHVVPNAVPVDVFRPVDRREARARLDLPQDRLMIGTGALNAMNDPRKGVVHLQEAVRALAARAPGMQPMLLVFGADAGTEQLAIPATFAGTIEDDRRLALLYAAMDVFVCPSIQENLPNTVAEALASGTPCVAFRIGGIPDLVEHGRSGYLAHPFETDDLCSGILHCLDPDRNRGLASVAREQAVGRLSPAVVAARYMEIYEETVSRHARDARTASDNAW